MMDDMAARKKRFEDRIKALGDAACKAMLEAEVQKIEEPDFTVSIRKGTPKVVIADEDQIPAFFINMKPVLDKAKIKAQLQDGEPVPGATLSNAEPTITVRVK